MWNRDLFSTSCGTIVSFLNQSTFFFCFSEPDCKGHFLLCKLTAKSHFCSRTDLRDCIEKLRQRKPNGPLSWCLCLGKLNFPRAFSEASRCLLLPHRLLFFVLLQAILQPSSRTPEDETVWVYQSLLRWRGQACSQRGQAWTQVCSKKMTRKLLIFLFFCSCAPPLPPFDALAVLSSDGKLSFQISYTASEAALFSAVKPAESFFVNRFFAYLSK